LIEGQGAGKGGGIPKHEKRSKTAYTTYTGERDVSCSGGRRGSRRRHEKRALSGVLGKAAAKRERGG